LCISINFIKATRRQKNSSQILKKLYYFCATKNLAEAISGLGNKIKRNEKFIMGHMRVDHVSVPTAKNRIR
jgi:hypothetical protein